MKTQKTSLETKDPNNANKSKYPVATMIIVGLCIFGMVGLYLIEITPRYTIIPVSPPEDSYGVGWNSITKSVWTLSSTSTVRVFIWRQEATLSYESTDNIPSWNSIAMYFNERLSQLGWEQNESSFLCNLYLPESAFLQLGENGFLSYHKSSDRTSDNSYYETFDEDAICLAIWNNKGHSDVFRVVLLTTKNSFFTNLFSVFEL